MTGSIASCTASNMPVGVSGAGLGIVVIAVIVMTIIIE